MPFYYRKFFNQIFLMLFEDLGSQYRQLEHPLSLPLIEKYLISLSHDIRQELLQLPFLVTYTT